MLMEVKALMVEQQHNEDAGKIPLHILLKSQCNLLHREKAEPIHLLVKEKRFLENIAAASNMSLPLIQPEALLFPSIFWKENSDGSFPGAIPASLYNGEKYNRQMGFAGMEEMLKTRLKDGNLLTSTTPTYIQFVFDCFMNQQLCGQDVRVVLNRGWQELNKVPQHHPYVGSKSFKFDCAEGRKNGMEVAALLRDVRATYFLTYTCSQSTHPGIRKIFEAIEKCYPECTTTKEKRLVVIQRELMPMLRAWHRASEYIMNWVKFSPEQPLGPAYHLWYRYEWQDETAAFPHIHAILCTGENKSDDNVKSRICCSREHFLGSLEEKKPQLTAKKKTELGNLFQKYQSHNCRKGKNRCKKKTEHMEEPVCRVPKYPSSVDFSYKQITINFSTETWELLNRMNLCEIDENVLTYKVKDELRAGKYHYPANYNEHISPTNATFFALVQSSSNVQICDEYMSARYIAKYAAGVETRGFARTVAGKDESSVKVISEEIENEKITGVNRTVQKRRAQEKQRSVHGRLVSITECLWWCLKLPYVMTNVISFMYPQCQKNTDQVL